MEFLLAVFFIHLFNYSAFGVCVQGAFTVWFACRVTLWLEQDYK